MNYEDIKKYRWQTKKGETFGATPPFKIMGIVESWVVMRRPRCMPCVVHINDFGKNKECRFVAINQKELTDEQVTEKLDLLAAEGKK